MKNVIAELRYAWRRLMRDPAFLVAAAFDTMVLIVLAASLLPMLRASKSDPAAVLREAS